MRIATYWGGDVDRHWLCVERLLIRSIWRVGL